MKRTKGTPTRPKARSKKARPTKDPKAEVRSRGKGPSTLGRFLNGLDPDDLKALLIRALAEVPGLVDWFEQRRALEAGEEGLLVERVRALVGNMASEPDWDDGRSCWDVDRTDYDALERSLEALLEAGGADAILDLGKDLLAGGVEEMELYHHDDVLWMDVQRCLGVVWRALPKSTLGETEQLLYAIDMSLQDDYGIVPDLEQTFRRQRKKRVWSEVADRLVARVGALPVPEPGGKASGEGKRSRLLDVTVDALDLAGRAGDADALRERESRRTGSYRDWVRRLLAEERPEEAERRALEGLAAETPDTGLHDLLRQAVAAQGDWKRLAALRAEVFRAGPGLESYADLLAAAGKARVKRAVREAALLFLEEEGGGSPKKKPAKAQKSESRERWGLPPVSELARLPENERAPRLGVRLEIALAEGPAAEVLRCFEHMQVQKDDRYRFGYRARDQALAVARAVAKTHPEEALVVYDSVVDATIAVAKPDAYVEAAGYLEVMRPLFKRLGRPEAWAARIADLRTEHKRRWRLVEVLDGLAGKPVVARRRRRR